MEIFENKIAAFRMATICHETTKILSNEGISTLIIPLTQFQARLKFYLDKAQRPLMVFGVDTAEDWDGLKKITNNLDMTFVNWFLLIHQNAGQNVCEYCRNPQENVLNLKFTSKIIVSCCGSNMIDEWWSVKKTHTKKLHVGNLSIEYAKIVWFFNDFINPHRHSMDGEILRIAAVKVKT